MYAELIKKAKSQCILHDVMLELTYACNLDCYICYNHKEKPGAPLSLDHYIQLLDGLASLQTLYVTLTGGEPLLHPHFFEIGSAARERGFVVRIKSGGHGLGGKVARRLKDEVDPFAVDISLHGATAEVHDRQTRVSGSFDYLVENVPQLRDMGLRPILISALTRWNEHQIGNMFELADSLGVPLRFQGPIVPRDDGDEEPLEIQPTEEGWRQYWNEMSQRSDIQPVENSEVRLQEGPKDANAPYCGTGSDSVIIDPFGNVYPCLRIRRSAGNLHDQTIESIWSTSTVLPEVRKIAINTTHRIQKEGPLSSMGAPVFCPGLELMGCETKCGGCG